MSSGKFDTRHVKKYATPKSLKHVLWNTVGSSTGAMRICLEIIKEELVGQIAGVPAEFKDLPEQIISFMYKEAGEDIHNTITFINGCTNSLASMMTTRRREIWIAMSKPFRMMKLNQLLIFLSPRTGVNNRPVINKTQGPLPGAQQTSLADGIVIEPATEAGGDKEGVQSASMVEGG